MTSARHFHPVARIISSLLIGALAFPPLATAGTVAGTGGSTEVTQLLNNGQLTASVAKQAAMVAEQVKANITALQSYMTMLVNLKNLPQDLLNATLAPFRQQLEDLRSIYSSVQSLRQSADDVRSMFSRRMTEMGSLNMSPRDYLAAESTLAATRGGIYESQMNSDLAMIDNLQKRSEQLRTISDKIPSISGNIEGLQTLNQQTNMLTGEMMDLKAAILQQNIQANMERAAQQRKASIDADTAAANAAKTDEWNKRNKAFADDIQFAPSWSK